MTARDLTRDGLVRALAAAVPKRPAVATALAREAGAVAQRAAGEGLAARILPHGAGRYVVEVRGPGLFSRAFGSRDAPADELVPTLTGEA